MGKTISCSVLLALISCFYLLFATALDIITPSKSIKDTEVIISQNGVFRLGFFSLANSSNRYVGILYHQIPVQTVVWVANRNRPLKDSSGILNISDDGNLAVLNGKNEILWSSNVNNTAPSTTTAQLRDSGNLVLSNGDDAGSSLWESFEDPSNAFIETMEISTDVKKGRKVELKSWKSIDDPSDGNFSLGIEPFNITELVIRNNNQLYFRSGPWNGNIFIRLILMYTDYLDGFEVVADNPQQPDSMTYEFSNESMLIYYELDSQGKFVEREWDAGKGNGIPTNSKFWEEIMGKTISCSVLLALISCFYLLFATALDIITPSKSIKDPDVIISQNGVFRLGFFSLANSTNRYVGILYNQIPVQTVVWVANRNRPLKDSSGILNISDDGNLVVSNGKAEVLWSSHVNNTAPNATTAQLLDSGNLVLSNGEDGASSLWESFEDPSNAFIETMKISTDVKTGRKVELKSWKSIDDPSDGNFSFGIEPFNIRELVIRNNNQLYFRSGPWNGNIFIGLLYMYTDNLDGFEVFTDKSPYYMTYESSNESMLIYYELDSQGKFVEREWDAGKGDWSKNYPTIQTDCDVYGKCGAFGICDLMKRTICSCLKGFEPRNIEEWSRGNWSSGCFRTTPLQCQRDNNNGSGAGQGDDGFLEMKMMKVPAFPARSSIINGECKDQCMKNCSCMAYAYDSGIGCMMWSGDLIDVQKFSTGGVDLYIRMPSSELDKGKSSKIIVITTVIAGIVLPVINFEELATATNNFNHAKKLGQGGFGPVYRGTLDDGNEIAVKRLSKTSGQGLKEFMNEVVVISKLQHRNLVRLLGCCVEGEEKILVYEYMPNKSLDTFLFDPAKQDVLDWRKRFNIIEGISRGLLYLHRDSRPKIIHRDLKTSNILLDKELNPKISDFGLAKIFGGDENQANTKRVVGTYGYMPPEYVMQGQFSEKSDVFSFGVLLLEVVSGRRSTSFYNNQYELSLLGYAWKLWREGDIWGIVDKVILESESYSKNETEIWRCIHVGLLCVQEFAKDRPTMPTVVSMLNSEISNLNTPKQPAFTQTPLITQDVEDRFSLNYVTVTDFGGR
ncbi:hypothetical protein GOBAR_DD20362 [Gossypium barbadense]|nr:hypothetical protein GOBAR_DD20362 [Gossypium barbadense]